MIGELAAPLELTAPIGDGPVLELDDIGTGVADAHARAVAVALALVTGVELDLSFEVLALGVRGQKVVEPARNIFITPT
ncbi:MAG: hypothetical protein FJZ38_23530 [Candidatus Rokubacteria bacterium]|nr:hypothetical protein [Candidatus Rokubacteria bacterium]